MTIKCVGVMGLIFGHNFIPCFSISSARPIEAEGSGGFVAMVMEKSREKTYHHSVCQRCGAVTGESK